MARKGPDAFAHCSRAAHHSERCCCQGGKGPELKPCQTLARTSRSLRLPSLRTLARNTEQGRKFEFAIISNSMADVAENQAVGCWSPIQVWYCKSAFVLPELASAAMWCPPIRRRPRCRLAVQVATWLTGTLHLPADVAEAFERNAVAGADLAMLSDTDMAEHLGLAPLQVWLKSWTELPPRCDTLP
jgi:hypothetical protein